MSVGISMLVSGCPPTGEITLMRTQQTPEKACPPTMSTPSDHDLLVRSRDGDEDAASELYLRYAKRLNRLVERQCSAGLAQQAGVEDIVQSAFGSFIRGFAAGPTTCPAVSISEAAPGHHPPQIRSESRTTSRPTHSSGRRGDAPGGAGTPTDGGQSQEGYFVLVVEEILENWPPKPARR